MTGNSTRFSTVWRGALAAGALGLLAVGVAPANADVIGPPIPPVPAAATQHRAANTAADELYVNPHSNAADWVAANGGDGRASAIDTNIAKRPHAKWFGDWNSDVQGDVSSYVDGAGSKTPVLVAYDMYHRDCGGASGGGADSPDAYKSWINGFAAGVGDRRAIVIIEPDALAQLDCQPDDGAKQTRLDLVHAAVTALHDKAPNALSYVDAGNAGWIDPNDMAQRLKDADVAEAHGFALNVSNYKTTADSGSYGGQVDGALRNLGVGDKPFTVDTSRNGNGSNGEWCNPAGRKLGTPPTLTGTNGAESLLWIKDPGDSDGPCGIGPNDPAGQFDPDLAMSLVNGG